MKKDLASNGYKFYSTTYVSPEKTIFDKDGRIDDFNKLVENKIHALNNRINELKEIQNIIENNKQFYLFVDNDGNYFYLDNARNEYKYEHVHGKHILIGRDLTVYEIEGYYDVDDMYSYEFKKHYYHIDKIICVKR